MKKGQIEYEKEGGVYIFSYSSFYPDNMLENNIINMVNEIYLKDDSNIKESPIMYQNEKKYWVGFKQKWKDKKCETGMSTLLRNEDKEKAIIELLESWI